MLTMDKMPSGPLIKIQTPSKEKIDGNVLIIMYKILQQRSAQCKARAWCIDSVQEYEHDLKSSPLL